MRISTTPAETLRLVTGRADVVGLYSRDSDFVEIDDEVLVVVDVVAVVRLVVTDRLTSRPSDGRASRMDGWITVLVSETFLLQLILGPGGEDPVDDGVSFAIASQRSANARKLLMSLDGDPFE